MNISFVDLKKQYASLKPDIDAAIQRVLDDTAFIGGAEVERFEEEFARFSESKHAVAVSSGTAALELIFRALGFNPGDEVLVPTNSYIASAYAPSSVGAQVVLVDADAATYNIDPIKAAEKITPRTRAICITHLYGQSAAMGPLMALAKKHSLMVIEDACQAHGARYQGTRVGNFGIATAFSFYPGKNLGAYGDGGAITSNDADLARRLKLLREYGQTEKYVHVEKGTNARLDALQAAILRVKLEHLETWNAKRREHAAYYTEKLQGLPITTPTVDPDGEPVFHVYAIETDRRDELLTYMKERGVQGNIHYPIPIHLQEAYAELGHTEGDFPVSEKAAKRLLSLPMYPELTQEDMDAVVQVLTDFYRS